MKTIGLIGGMSWESTIPYYQIINETVKDKLGGFHSAKILMYSVDFAELESYMSTGQWDKNAEILSTAAQTLEKGGADFIVICTNTMHKLLFLSCTLQMPLQTCWYNIISGKLLYWAPDIQCSRIFIRKDCIIVDLKS
jgi:aspartate racemase